MKTIIIENNQKSGKYAGTVRIVNAPDWLLSGDYAGFLADTDIDQEKAFAALVNYARQHLPVAFRTKALNAHSVYRWLDGKMQGGSTEKAEGIELLVKGGMDRKVLETKTVKEIKAMVEVYRTLHPEEATE